jgi:hypothetical protein
MRRSGAIIAALALIAVLGLVTAASLNQRSQAFTLGVTRAANVALKPREEICQAPIAVPADGAFDGVTFAVGTEQRRRPELAVSVRAADSEHPGARRGGQLAGATLPAGNPGVGEPREHTVWLDHGPAERVIAVCIANRGERPVLILGNGAAAARSSSAFLGRTPLGSDLALEFERRESRSLTSLAPTVIDRAALFRANVIGPWTYYLLGLLVILAVPALLVRALRAAEHDGI